MDEEGHPIEHQFGKIAVHPKMQIKFESFPKMQTPKEERNAECWEKGKWEFTVADRLQDVSMDTGSTKAFLLENEPHAYAAATATFLAASFSFEVPLLPPPPSPILSFLFTISVVCVKAYSVRGLPSEAFLCLCLWWGYNWCRGTDEREREKKRDKELCKIQQWAASVAVAAVTFVSHYYCCCVLSSSAPHTRLYNISTLHFTTASKHCHPYIIIIFAYAHSHLPIIKKKNPFCFYLLTLFTSTSNQQATQIPIFCFDP